MEKIAVIGCGFGDEGKGRIVDDLCCKIGGRSLVVRFSGGHQAGHHVVRDGFDHVFSNFGSGSFEGADTYWSKFCTVDPVGIINELSILKDKGVDPTLYIDERCPVTTPFDKIYNEWEDTKYDFGSCGVGFGATLQREEDHYHLLFRDLFYPMVLAEKLYLIEQYYRSKATVGFETFKFDNPLYNIGFQTVCKNTISLPGIYRTFGFPAKIYDTYVYEGSQGLLLDQDIGFFPHVTRSNTGLQNIAKMSEDNQPMWLPDKVILVTRAYQTRHGKGPMSNLFEIDDIKENPYEQNNDDGFQGVFRKSVLDLDLLAYAIDSEPFIREHPKKTLIVTCCDLIHPKYTFIYENKFMTVFDKWAFARDISNILNIDVHIADPLIERSI